MIARVHRIETRCVRIYRSTLLKNLQCSFTTGLGRTGLHLVTFVQVIFEIISSKFKLL